jgi:hypothetical protein
MHAHRDSSVSLASDVFQAPPVRKSLHEAAMAEALRHKWIESEKAQRDLGDWAIVSWFHKHWNAFARRCWVEHLEGRVFWIELDHGDFGMLQKELSDSVAKDEVLRRVKTGGENLDILCWTQERRLPGEEVWKILSLLEKLDINGHRVECKFDTRLLQAG